MQKLRIKHTAPVAGLNYKHEDGKTPVKLGETVEMSANMARTLAGLGWGILVDKDGNDLSKARQERMIAAGILNAEKHAKNASAAVKAKSASEKARSEVIAAIKAVTEEGKE